MLYFLVNNNFHLIDAEEHLKVLKKFKTTLIKIPHQLTISSTYSFDLVVEFPVLIRKPKDYLNLPRIFKLHREIDNLFKDVKSVDTLIFYTEYELLSHYIVTLFKKKGAKVVLIEEGIPTYLTFTGKYDLSPSLKQKLLGYYLRYVLGYSNSKMVRIDGWPVNILADSQIDQLLLYTDIKIRRNVPTALLELKKIDFKQLNSNTALFLNEPMYKYFANFFEYLTIVEDILGNLSLKFEKVYFKFHPRETIEARNDIKKTIEKYPKVSVIDDNQPVEFMIESIGAKYVVSFAAQTLLYLSNSNCVVLYVFHIYPKLMSAPTFVRLKNVIDNMSYIFMNNWSEIETETLGFMGSDKSNKHTSLQKYLDL
jgi:hypothetical protein